MHLCPGQLRIVLVFSLLQQLTLKRQSHILSDHLHTDLQRCHDCFSAQLETCLQLYESLEEPADLNKLLKAIALRFDRRQIYWLYLPGPNGRLLAKRRTGATAATTVDHMRQQILGSTQRVGQFQLCNANGSETPRFVAYFQQRGFAQLTIWLYMLDHISPMLMHELWRLHWPVPRSYAACGLTHLQAYAGRTLNAYVNAALQLRLRLAQQLLELALQFTYGFDNFRIYITDFTVYNFAYDEEAQQLLLIDMDTIVLVDASRALKESSKYVPLPGEGFTYDVAGFCAGQQVDANVYQACLLLSEFLLMDLPESHTELEQLLVGCVACADDLCDLRFQYAYDLIKLIRELLE